MDDIKLMPFEMVPVVQQKFPDVRFIFSPWFNEAQDRWQLTVAVENQEGHNPLPYEVAHSNQELTMQNHCNDLNDALGVDPYDVIAIMTSTLVSPCIDEN